MNRNSPLTRQSGLYADEKIAAAISEAERREKVYADPRLVERRQKIDQLSAECERKGEISGELCRAQEEYHKLHGQIAAEFKGKE